MTAGGPRPVRATYRVQLVPERGFDAVAEQLDYLAALGVSHVYLSPVLQAVPGSRHGYDVTDPTRIRDELGGADGLERLRQAAHAAGLGLVADIVPNHVGLVSPHNPWWWDVLAHGPAAAHARHLDVHWRDGAHGQPSLLLAELGDEPEAELAAGTLRLEYEPTATPPWRVTYHEHAWPVRPGSLELAGLDADDVAGTLAMVSSDTGRLADLLEHQHYRLAHWRRANDELDHRRFFAVKELGGLRVEDEAVFDDVHAAILPRVEDGTFDGLRIDHPDGLRDPVEYLRRLRRAVGDDTWLIVEKILERGEPFRHEWPVDGTVGYEFADLVLGLHVDGAAGPILDDLHAEVTGQRIERDLLHDRAKRLVIHRLLGAEVRRVTGLLADASGLGAADAQRLVEELLAVWPVYRTYLRPGSGEVADQDREVVAHAVARVRARHEQLPGLDDVREMLLEAAHRDAAHPAAAFVWAFQQLTGPVVAKGVEDTVLYRDLRFVAVNEVGGDPGELGRTPGEVHAAHVRAQHDRPRTMLLSSTHDTKRSADVRARLAVLSQDPGHWVRTVQRWRQRTARHVLADGPGPAHQHLTFQTLVGAWPLDADRLEAYLLKAAREAARASDHLDPDPAYEGALSAYARSLLDDAAFRADLEEVVDEVRVPGWLTALSMVAVKLTAPGVADLYQGDELWDLSLVDPDNRRPVDVARRRRALTELETADATPDAIMARLEDGLPKLHLIRAALQLRARREAAFGPSGSYAALWPRGPRADHVFGYLRGGEVAVVTARQVRPLGPRVADWDWRDTTVDLPAGDWVDVLTGARHGGSATGLARLLTTFPVALLEREDLPPEGSSRLPGH